MLQTIHVPAGSRWLLFDVGNVLADDYWQTLVFTPWKGLAHRYGISVRKAEAVGSELWARFATDPDGTDEEWWSALEAALSITVTPTERAALHGLIRANAEAVAQLRDMRERGLEIGLITDNTAFWLPKQVEVAGLSRLVSPDLVFASFALGAVKPARPGLYDIAAGVVDPARTLVIDDRVSNLSIASDLGFSVSRYSFSDVGTSVDD